MRLTKRNVKVAIEILTVLAENKCTVADVSGIFSYIEGKIRNETTVPNLDYDALLGELVAGCDE